MSHFSAHVVAREVTAYACLNVRARLGGDDTCDVDLDCLDQQDPNDVCVDGHCFKEAVDVEINADRWYASGDATCVRMPANRRVHVRLRSVVGTPDPVRYEATFLVDAPGSGSSIHEERTLFPVPWGCIEGSLPECGVFWVEDASGLVSAFEAAGNPCAFCAVAPVAEEAWVRASNGDVYAVGASPAPGRTCGQGAACDAVGALAAPSLGVVGSIEVTIRLATRRSMPGSTYEVDLDAAASQGDVHTYQWEVEDADGNAVWASTTADPETTVVMDPGTYVARVRVLGGRRDADQATVPVELPSAVEHLLTVVVTGPGAVTGPSIDCDESGYPLCLAGYPEDTEVLLTADPRQPYNTFDQWTGCPSPSGLECTVVMDSDHAVAAGFSGP